MKNSMDSNIKSFLKLGYFLDYHNPYLSFDLRSITKTEPGLPKTEITEKIYQLFLLSVEKNFRADQEHVVPISGGFDSRLILAVLREFTETKNIKTYTFGTPHTFDYEIGNRIANKLQTRHYKIDLSNYEYCISDLLDASKCFSHQTILFYHPPIRFIREIVGDSSVWSGFMGDPLAGSKLKPIPSKTLDIAINHYFSKNMILQKAQNVILDNNDMIPLLDLDLSLHEGALSIDEQIDFKNRQLKYIAPHVVHGGINFKLPFIDSAYMSFILSLPDKYRVNQVIFREMLVRKYPYLFSFPSKNYFGASINTSNFKKTFYKYRYKFIKKILSKWPIYPDPNTNYLDFTKKIREDVSLQNLLFGLLTDLKGRHVIEGFNLEIIIKEHISGKKDNSKLILLLSSLEVHLKAGKKR